MQKSQISDSVEQMKNKYKEGKIFEKNESEKKILSYYFQLIIFYCDISQNDYCFLSGYSCQ